jgi:uncharacterized hydrophobic protein (TIGR00271 family)
MGEGLKLMKTDDGRHSDLSIRAKDRYAEAIENIRKSAVYDRSQIVMNILSTIMACYGLFSNSPAVVIGAMVVAMLLGPIVGLALALVEGDHILLRKAVLNEVVGAGIVFLAAAIIGLVNRDIPITNEIMSRTAPNFFDLMIALAGGAAMAYAIFSPSLGLSLVGVAIATALVPPLSSSAILLVRGEYTLSGGAFLLFIGNVVAIEFAASIVLLFFMHTKESLKLRFELQELRRNLVSILSLLVLGVIFSANLRHVVKEQLYKVKTHAILQAEVRKVEGDYLDDIRYQKTPGALIVRAVVRGPHQLTPEQVSAMETKMPPDPNGLTTDFRVRFVQATVITSHGFLYTDSEDQSK